jgi:hypothetical protein
MELNLYSFPIYKYYYGGNETITLCFPNQLQITIVLLIKIYEKLRNNYFPIRIKNIRYNRVNASVS